MVGAQDVPNAVALNSSQMSMARLVGPAVAGLMIDVVGGGWVFLINALSFVATITVLACMRREEFLTHPRPQRRQGLADGFRYVRRRGDLMTVLAIAFVLGTFGMNFPIFASNMAIEFGHAANGFGLLGAAMGLGSLVGALLAARRDRARISVIVIGTLAFGVTMGIAMLMPDFWLYALATALAGMCVTTMMTTTNGYIQTNTEFSVRGRVLAILFALQMGGTVIGAPTVGAITDALGARAGVAVAAIAGLVGAIIGGSYWLSRRRRGELFTAPVSVIDRAALLREGDA
jgi:MFS family permease